MPSVKSAAASSSACPSNHVERAALAHLLGDEAVREHELHEAHQLFTEMGATARAEQATREL